MPKGVGYFVSGSKEEKGKKLLGIYDGQMLVQPMKKEDSKTASQMKRL